MSSIAGISVVSLTPAEWCRLARRNLERIAAVVTMAAIVWARASITESFASQAWNIDNFYSAVFNWASVQGAFLFGFYAFFLARSEPFIQAVAASPVFEELRDYVRKIMYLTLFLTAAVLPATIAIPKMAAYDYLSPAFLSFACFATALSYTFFAFLKVIRVFGKLERARRR